MNKLLIFLSMLLCFSIINSQEYEVVVDTDYTPATTAYTQLQAIIMKHQQFKNRVKKNVSIEYSQCVDTIKTLRCNNIDQWQSVVEELKLENDNSDKTEIPYLQKRKEGKVDLLKKYLDETSHENEVLADIQGKIQANQKKIMNYYYYLDNMYKVAQTVENEQVFVQLKADPAPDTKPADAPKAADTKPADAPKTTAEPTPAADEPQADDKNSDEPSASTLLNADVPDLAKEQLGQAKNEYDQADESIQAQTTSNMLKSYTRQTIQTLNNLNRAFDSRFEDLEQNKLKAKSDILKARSLIKNEEDIKARNGAKIGEMEGLIAACQGKPTNIEKDCEPLRVNASKIITEIDIIQARSLLLDQELSAFIEENQNEDQLKAKEGQLTAVAQAVQTQDEINYYLSEKEPAVIPRPITELHPVHHFKENIKDSKDKPADAPADKPADAPADKPADAPADKPADAPADKPADKPAEAPK